MDINEKERLRERLLERLGGERLSWRLRKEGREVNNVILQTIYGIAALMRGCQGSIVCCYIHYPLHMA